MSCPVCFRLSMSARAIFCFGFVLFRLLVACVFVFQIDILRPLCFSGREIHPESKIETVMVALQVEHIAAWLLFLLLDRKLKLLVRQYLHISYTILGSSFFFFLVSIHLQDKWGEDSSCCFGALVETPANEIISFFLFFFMVCVEKGNKKQGHESYFRKDNKTLMLELLLFLLHWMH